MDLNTESVKSLPVWAQLPDLDVKYWKLKSLSKIGSILGIPIKTDRYTKVTSVIKYAGLLIEMSLEGPFPEYIEFFNDNEVLPDQFIHWHATQLSTNKGFYITFVYGMNNVQQRQQPWADLQGFSQQMTEAWCIMGDFNSVLYKEDRMGGNEILDHELEDLNNLMHSYQLRKFLNQLRPLLRQLSMDHFADLRIQSLPVWAQLPDLDVKYWKLKSLSKIGSVLGIPIETDRYTKVTLVIKYAGLLIEMSLEGPFPDCIEFFDDNEVLIRHSVLYKEDRMGGNEILDHELEDLSNLMHTCYSNYGASLIMDQLRKFLNQLRPILRQLSMDHIADLGTQQEKARKELTNI
ncbi:hypothetical protein Cgig2_004423 [Carnegiea gigantea]|uniref:Uncharacterized protein n=1 Tax=Carnegiea gigantea TaxID=171969 RepID=A0A9Q1QA43_9CARY|nr:hypothetical protein Cgig2_004423 [Carnegiea gigantea]